MGSSRASASTTWPPAVCVGKRIRSTPSSPSPWKARAWWELGEPDEWTGINTNNAGPSHVSLGGYDKTGVIYKSMAATTYSWKAPR